MAKNPRRADEADEPDADEAAPATPPSAQPVHQAGEPGADPEGPGAPQATPKPEPRLDESPRPGGYYLNAAGQAFDAEGKPIKD
jgi:hypothetical protein